MLGYRHDNSSAFCYLDIHDSMEHAKLFWSQPWVTPFTAKKVEVDLKAWKSEFPSL